MATQNCSVSIFQRLREEIELEYSKILVLLSNKKSNLFTFLANQELDYNNANRQIQEDIDRLNRLRHDTEELLSTNNLGDTQEIILHQIDSRLTEFMSSKIEDPILSLEWDREGLSDLIDKIEIKIGVFHPHTQELLVVSSQDLISIQPEVTEIETTTALISSQTLELVPFSTQSDLESDW